MTRRRGPRDARATAPGGHARGGGGGRVRIIGGRWRGSRLEVADVAGLRPTTDRTRETLFNWLQGVVPDARCLDLFAGSGALGLEAASRGAASVVLVERDAAQAATLRGAVARLQRSGPGVPVEVVAREALAWLRNYAGAPFDLVFLDPPFSMDPWPSVFEVLPAHLATVAWVYIESAVDTPPAVPPTWRLQRSLRSHEVEACLYLVPGRAGEGRAAARAGSGAADTLRSGTSFTQDPNAG
jgi:16S rRNA (guanine966-N2)-methyltransferase